MQEESCRRAWVIRFWSAKPIMDAGGTSGGQRICYKEVSSSIQYDICGHLETELPFLGLGLIAEREASDGYRAQSRL